MQLHRVPKVELHRHLEGSLRIDTLRQIAIEKGLSLPEPGLPALVQVQPGEGLNFTNFLAKFKTLRLFFDSPEVIARLAREAVEDAAEDGVMHFELRFTPLALARAQGFALADVMDWVAHAARDAARKAGIGLRLIASCNRHEPVQAAEEVAALALERTAVGFAGLDLAGNEAEFPAAPFIGVMRAAKEAGLRITIHAGEWGGPSNIRQAIEDFGADRIGHGVCVLSDPYTTDLARERGTVFEVCPTSNYQSGVVRTVGEHPLPRMLRAGLKVAICTDDPSISGITLTGEHRLAVESLGITEAELLHSVRTAAEAAFLPEPEKIALRARLDLPH